MAKTSRGAPPLTRRFLADEVAAGILDVIRTDGLRGGDALPPITELAERLRVSRTVVREAIDQLCGDGVILRSAGRQWLVKEQRGGQRRPGHTVNGDERVSHRSLADQAADAVLEMILSEGLREGDALPPSGELAKRYDVSIVVIREALASLAARGILQRRQGRESVVAMPGYDILSSILRVRAHLDEIDVDEFQECRASLELKAADLAARIGSPEEKREAFEGALEGLRNSRTPREFNEHDLTFHLTLAKLSGNRAIHLMLEALDDVLRESMEVTYRRVEKREGRRGIEQAIENHEDVAEAVICGDPDAAREALIRHFVYSSRSGG